MKWLQCPGEMDRIPICLQSVWQWHVNCPKYSLPRQVIPIGQSPCALVCSSKNTICPSGKHPLLTRTSARRSGIKCLTLLGASRSGLSNHRTAPSQGLWCDQYATYKPICRVWWFSPWMMSCQSCRLSKSQNQRCQFHNSY